MRRSTSTAEGSQFCRLDEATAARFGSTAAPGFGTRPSTGGNLGVELISTRALPLTSRALR